MRITHRMDLQIYQTSWSNLMIFQRHTCISLCFLQWSKYSAFWVKNRPSYKPGPGQIPLASKPCFPVESRNVHVLLWLWVPQEPPVNLKALTSGCSLPLFALHSAHSQRPPWCESWDGSLFFMYGQGRHKRPALTWSKGEVHRVFQFAFVFVSVTPFERFLQSRHTFIIISPLLVPYPSGINYAWQTNGQCFAAVPSNTHPQRRDTSGLDAPTNNLLPRGFCLLLWQSTLLLSQWMIFYVEESVG